jgi:hypothetical protein
VVLVAAANDDMIVDPDVQQLARLHKPAREPQVFTARLSGLTPE